MHSPEALAFSIVRPWPQINKSPMRKTAPKWQLPIVRRDDGSFFISRFAYANGYELYWPSMFDIWHMEPGGHDSGSVCKSKWYKDKQGRDRCKQVWKWHVHHWKITPVFIYNIRRRLLTRCAECGGPDRKGNRVNHSNSGWGGGPKVPLWCGEVHLYHADCLAKLSKQHHAHDPRGCYACSGKASFDFNRKDRMPRTLPTINPFMPPKQREMLSSLKISMDLGLVTQEAAVKSYFEQKKAVEWQ